MNYIPPESQHTARRFTSLIPTVLPPYYPRVRGVTRSSCVVSHICLVLDLALQLPRVEVAEVLAREERIPPVLAAKGSLGPL